jgi:hypothetical protein
MTRVVINGLDAWDSGARNWVTLHRGMVLGNCHIGFNKRLGGAQSPSPYSAEFEIDGRQLSCALPAFQARTEICKPTLETAPAGLAGDTATAEFAVERDR